MANIIPFIRFTALENVEFVGFSSIVGITNIVTIQTGYDDLESIGCQLGDGRWIIVVWNRDEDRSTAYPAYYSELSNVSHPSPLPISNTSSSKSIQTRIASRSKSNSGYRI